MNSALIFILFQSVLEVSSKTYFFEDLCEAPSLVQIESPHFSLGRFSSTRRFGSTVNVKSGENLIMVLGSALNTKTKTLQDSELLEQNLNLRNSWNSTNNSTNQKENNSTYDCSFGFKSSSNLTFTIHWHGFITNCKSYLQIFQEANKIMLSLHEKGNYVFNATRLIPINLRVSTCESKNYGLIIIVTTQDDPEQAVLLSSFLKTFTSFFAPFFGFSFVAILIGCCLVNRSRWFSSDRANKVQKADKPPKYDDLFPKNVRVESPPSYEECATPKN